MAVPREMMRRPDRQLSSTGKGWPVFIMEYTKSFPTVWDMKYAAGITSAIVWNVTIKWKSGEIESLTDTRESHEGGSVLCRSDLKVTLRVLQTTSQERAPQN